MFVKSRFSMPLARKCGRRTSIRWPGFFQSVRVRVKAIAIYQQTGEGRKEAAAFYEPDTLLRADPESPIPLK